MSICPPGLRYSAHPVMGCWWVWGSMCARTLVSNPSVVFVTRALVAVVVKVVGLGGCLEVESVWPKIGPRGHHITQWSLVPHIPWNP